MGLYFTTAGPFFILYIAWPWKANINENVQPPFGGETVTKYCAILFVNIGKYMNLCNNNNHTLFFNAFLFNRSLKNY